MKPIFLAESANVCIHGKDVVFLDLQSGKYLALNVDQAGVLGRVVKGWPIAADERDTSQTVNLLLQKGLLTTDPARGKQGELINSARATRALIDMPINHRPPVRVRDGWRFLIATSVAIASLRWIGLKRIARRVTHRRVARAQLPPTQGIERLQQIVSLFERLRPFMFRKTDACLLHSLALLEFLARYHIYPDWVFAVQTQPFKAHCWLQHGDWVLNDKPSGVAELTPIAII
jgi:hypothetical protein